MQRTDIIEKYCSEDLEYLMVKCRLFSMPRELTVIPIMAVYIPPQAIANVALEKLHTVVSKQQNVYPDGAVIVAGDYNHVDLKKILPKFNKNIFTPTRGNYFWIRCTLIFEELIKPLCHIIWAFPTMLH